MTVSITHAKVSDAAAPSDAALVGGPDWNDEHTVVASTVPGYEFDYVQITSPVSVTGTSEGAANTVITGSAVVYDGTTNVMVTFFSNAVDLPAVASESMIVLLYGGSGGGTLLGRLGTWTNTNSTTVQRHPVFLQRRVTPSAGSHTFIIKSLVGSGTGSVGAGAGGSGTNLPAFLRVTRA